MVDAPAGVEIWFYHLARRLEDALPRLLERSLERGWRAYVQCVGPERVAALDDWLWTYDEASFLPHQASGRGHDADQPILLGVPPLGGNAPHVAFLTEGASVEAALAANVGLARVAFIFDGADDAMLGDARLQWKALKAAGRALVYWRQSEDGRWARQG